MPFAIYNKTKQEYVGDDHWEHLRDNPPRLYPTAESAANKLVEFHKRAKNAAAARKKNPNAWRPSWEVATFSPEDWEIHEVVITKGYAVSLSEFPRWAVGKKGREVRDDTS